MASAVERKEKRREEKKRKPTDRPQESGKEARRSWSGVRAKRERDDKYFGVCMRRKPQDRQQTDRMMSTAIKVHACERSCDKSTPPPPRMIYAILTSWQPEMGLFES